jgi:hypothetical protein
MPISSTKGAETEFNMDCGGRKLIFRWDFPCSDALRLRWPISVVLFENGLFRKPSLQTQKLSLHEHLELFPEKR